MKLSNTDHILKIVAIGPESTGKSTLCTDLALHFSTHWCQEYAREYLIKNGTNYSYEDLLLIAKGQLALEEKALIELSIDHSKNDSTKRPLLFIDTDMYVMKVWSEFVFDQCDPWILNQIAERKYDGYLLCKHDIPWTKDELREYPEIEKRESLYNYYKDLLINQQAPWFEVTGSATERTQQAINWVDKLRKSFQ
jgi:NadR type nicotinamide-nucleotide adenylyltransferase